MRPLPLLALLVALMVSAQAQTITPRVTIGPTACPNGLVYQGQTVSGVAEGLMITIVYEGASQGPSYAVKCTLLPQSGGPQTDCPGFSDVPKTFSPYLTFTYALITRGKYHFTLCGPDEVSANCNNPHYPVDVTVIQGACNINDPIIVGFDGKSFHFDDVGEYVMLESGDGYQVHSTFAGAAAYNDQNDMMEKSWTSSVRLFSPNGDMLSCALPAILPNTSLLQVTAAAASLATTMLSLTKTTVELAEMSASALLSEGDEPKRVTGCILNTPKLEIRVDQVSGYQQAMLHPDTESWAAPFTWLDTTFVVKKPLAGPVTGIIGATYPADKVAEQRALYSEADGDGVTANMKGEGPAPRSHRRALADTGSLFIPISSGIVGLAPGAAPA
ncbi:hypothetical protein N2152v2_007011 [Parachlorella kessleri]